MLSLFFVLFSETHLLSSYSRAYPFFNETELFISKDICILQLRNEMRINGLIWLYSSGRNFVKYHCCFYDWKKAVVLTLLYLTLREKCPNTEFFLVRILLYSDWIQENTNQKKLRIWKLFTQWKFFWTRMILEAAADRCVHSCIVVMLVLVLWSKVITVLRMGWKIHRHIDVLTLPFLFFLHGNSVYTPVFVWFKVMSGINT